MHRKWSHDIGNSLRNCFSNFLLHFLFNPTQKTEKLPWKISSVGVSGTHWCVSGRGKGKIEAWSWGTDLERSAVSAISHLLFIGAGVWARSLPLPEMLALPKNEEKVSWEPKRKIIELKLESCCSKWSKANNCLPRGRTKNWEGSPSL